MCDISDLPNKFLDKFDLFILSGGLNLEETFTHMHDFPRCLLLLFVLIDFVNLNWEIVGYALS